MRERRFSIRGPVILFTLVLVLSVTLTVLWNVALVKDYQRLKAFAAGDEAFHWTFIALGSFILLAIIVLSCLLGIQLITNLRWSQRQANFIASVSHELNSPLSSIKLFAQTLRNDELSPADRTGFVNKILFDVDRLTRIIANILRAAETDNRGEALQVALQTVDLRDYLEDYAADARVLNAGKLELELDGAEDVPVAIDPMMFRQVLDNLVDNAVRYRGNKPAAVRFHLGRTDGRVELEVKDEGIGIPSDQLPHIFDRFFRIEAGHPGRQGMGIGLNVVRSIVRGHGGSIEASSGGPGRGALFSIRLPVAPKEPS